MENIVYNGDKYSNIFKLDDNTLLKYSEQNKDNWKYLIEHKKELPFLNIPTKVEDLDEIEKTIYETSCDSKTKIYLPYLKDYNTLFNEIITKNFYTSDILKLIKRILILIKDMHNKKVIHSDLHSNNIMINEDLDIALIDLDLSIINNNPSKSNPYFEDEQIENMIKYSKRDDKIDILNLLLYYLINSNFKKNDLHNVNIKDIMLPDNILNEFKNILNTENVSDDYYFIDLIDELLRIGYESPIIIRRKVLSKYDFRL